MFNYLSMGLLFACSAVYHLSKAPPHWDNVIIASGIVVALVLMRTWIKAGREKESAIIEWLHANKHQVTEAPRFFPDSPLPRTSIGNQTTIREFKVVTSFLIPTSIDNCGFHSRSPLLRGAVAVGWTLVFGWWALPVGPIATVRALSYNLTGGNVMSVRTIGLDSVSQSPSGSRRSAMIV
jgi:hypothetical protein